MVVRYRPVAINEEVLVSDIISVKAVNHASHSKVYVSLTCRTPLPDSREHGRHDSSSAGASILDGQGSWSVSLRGGDVGLV